MSTAVPNRRVVRFGVIFFGILAALAYGVMLVPALLGHAPNQQAYVGIALVSAAFFYCLWIQRGRAGWEGALVGLGVFLVAVVAATYVSTINPAH
jgi:hypothetical protein